ncbi:MULTISPECIES: hypothetical protein [Streptomyces]|nr:MULTISPECIES: hypothetical protein [Streptomyces]
MKCKQCGRRLTRPAADSLGPVCRRRQRAAHAKHARIVAAYRAKAHRIIRDRATRQPTPDQLALDEQEND